MRRPVTVSFPSIIPMDGKSYKLYEAGETVAEKGTVCPSDDLRVWRNDIGAILYAKHKVTGEVYHPHPGFLETAPSSKKK